jgi:hypothetical protein
MAQICTNRYKNKQNLVYGLNSWKGQEIFLFSIATRPALGPTQTPIQWVPDTLSPQEKQPEREADYLPLASAEVKNEWS